MNIKAENITMVYPSGKTALQDISVSMTSPNMIGILGPNGAGKTSLIKLLSCAVLPTKGEITFNGIPLLSQERAFKAKLGYLPQHFGLFDELTVWQFLDYMAALKGIKSKNVIEKSLCQTNLAANRKVRVSHLSGGMRQRLGIAQALLGDPEILILDEPTVGLDPEERASFKNLFSQLSREKIVLLSTHIVEDVQSICSNVLIINKGQIIFYGEPSLLISQTSGHAGVFVLQSDKFPSVICKVVSKINVRNGILYRIVSDNLPSFARPVEPTLEDAYLYMQHKGEI